MTVPMPLVLLTNPIEQSALCRLETRARAKIASNIDPGTLAREAEDADVIIVRAPLPAAVFSIGTRLKAVIRHGTGLDMIPVDQASLQAVAVANVPAVNARTVAEFVIAQMIALARRTPWVETGMRTESWGAGRRLAEAGVDLHGKTIAIVGTGAVGTTLASICSAGFGMRVLSVPRPSPSRIYSPDVVPLDGALPLSDFLVLACPLTAETRGLVNARRLALLKPGAHVINVARGAVLDEEALCDALLRGRIGGAALDVFADQPLAPDARLRTLPQVLLSPHIAGITVESMHRMSHGAVAQALQVLDGELPTHLVNTEVQAQILARWAAFR